MLEIEGLNAERELKSVFEGRLLHGFTTGSQKKVPVGLWTTSAEFGSATRCGSHLVL